MRNAEMTDAKPGGRVLIRELPHAKEARTVDSIRARLPELQQTNPAAIDLEIAQERSPTSRATRAAVEQPLGMSLAEGILVEVLFQRDVRGTVIPARSLRVTLLGEVLYRRLWR